MTDTIATHNDAKSLGYCNRGVRRWCDHHGVNFDQFRREGVSVAWLRATGDAMAEKLANYVEQKHVD